MPNASSNSLRVAVAGVTGYAGAELARILLHHPRLSTPPLFLGREGAEETPRLIDLHPALSGAPNADAAEVVPFSWDTLTKEGVNLLFLALPHEQSRELAPIALSHGIRVVDLSAAWRLQHDDNRAIYKLHDANPDCAAKLQAEAVYGSPELHAAQIKSARLVANPGCYATSVILGARAARPRQPRRPRGRHRRRLQVRRLRRGQSAHGHHALHARGRQPLRLRGLQSPPHRRAPRAAATHARADQFTPHLLPIPRGILSTLYVRLNKACTVDELQSCFDDFYANAPLVRVRRSPHLPQIQHVVRTSFCDLGFHLAPRRHRRLIVISCLDNLLKGAASQAVENMNLMAGFHQQEGLL